VPEVAPGRLADHTTLRLGGPAARWVRAESEAEIIGAVDAADAAGEPVLVLGAGSNLVVADAGFPGTVIEVDTRGIESDLDDEIEASCSGATVKVAAGEPWDPFVALAVERRWAGIEALAGIPGRVGATPIQNVGAYGQEVSQTIASVRVWDRRLRGVRTFAAADCGFGYRTSRFKQDPGRHVVLEVTFQLRLGTHGPPLEYAELARTLDLELGQRALVGSVREAVLALRTRKGMVLDPADQDTWSAGSFFTNPVIAADDVPDGAPAWPQPDGSVKTSAAWLIEQAGFSQGYSPADRQGRVSLSAKHPLALTNRGSASTEDLLALAREVRDGVRERFGITLVNEPVLVGCDL
jgi:UDP-N-acetylmuramate dehydrogenase